MSFLRQESYPQDSGQNGSRFYGLDALCARASAGLMRSILKPVNPRKSDMMGAVMLKMQNGRYSTVGMLSVAAMNAPHEFHGTSGDVTVPASAHARDRFCAFNPRFSNSRRYRRTGSTSAMY